MEVSFQWFNRVYFTAYFCTTWETNQNGKRQQQFFPGFPFSKRQKNRFIFPWALQLIRSYLPKHWQENLAHLPSHRINKAAHHHKPTTKCSKIKFNKLFHIVKAKLHQPIFRSCPSHSWTDKSELGPGNDGKDGGDEEDAGDAGHHVEHHPETSQGEGGACHCHDVLALVQLEELGKGLLHFLQQQLPVLFRPCVASKSWTYKIRQIHTLPLSILVTCSEELQRCSNKPAMHLLQCGGVEIRLRAPCCLLQAILVKLPGEGQRDRGKLKNRW